jgi:fructose-bisphosphate aldolase, class II
VHINTEIRVAYRKGLEAAFAADATEVAPAKYLVKGKESLKTVVRNRLKLFNRM